METFLYPVYFVRLQKERKTQAKNKKKNEKICTKAMSWPVKNWAVNLKP